MAGMDGFALTDAIRKDAAIGTTTVVMLTASGQPDDAARCKELGVAALISKPIHRAELRSTILMALTGHFAEPLRPALIVRHSLRKARRAGQILVVEDNMVNQTLARRLLQDRGHTVVVVNNGREALKALEETTGAAFEVVLMDVQMPEMGGFECTAIIRAREQITRFHLPIIAMTAHAMKGDAERCLAAGMDDYLSKPIQPDGLFEVVERHLDTLGVPVFAIAP
jgi:CheY-like chemotaxis protein